MAYDKIHFFTPKFLSASTRNTGGDFPKNHFFPGLLVNISPGTDTHPSSRFPFFHPGHLPEYPPKTASAFAGPESFDKTFSSFWPTAKKRAPQDRGK